MRKSSFRYGDVVKVVNCPVEEWNGKRGEVIRTTTVPHKGRLINVARVDLGERRVNFNEIYLELELRPEL